MPRPVAMPALSGAALLGTVLLGAVLAATATCAQACRPGARPMAKVELYLGAAGSQAASEAAWRRFLADVVTPRFPGGLTVLEGRGQWRGAHGLVREPTHILVVYYRPDATSEARIEAIRRLYRRRFAQQSVLRADSLACVAF